MSSRHWIIFALLILGLWAGWRGLRNDRQTISLPHRTNAEKTIAPLPTEANAPGVSGESNSPTGELAQMEPASPLDEWEQNWQRAFAELRTVARDEDLMTLIEELATTDPLRAIAVANGQKDSELRRELFQAAMRGWGGTNAESAIAWIQSQDLQDADEAIAAVFHGAARDPEAAMRLARKLSTQEPPRDYGAYLVAGLSRAGEFNRAVDVAVKGAEIHLDWLRAAYASWSDSEPQAALKNITELPDAASQRAAFDTAISRWAKRDPKALGQYALDLPEGYDRKLALSVALRAWAAVDLAEAARWITHFDPSTELDFGAAVIASLPETVRQPEIATSWAESIVDPRLRVRVLATIVNEWSAVDPSSARNYAQTSPTIRPEDRAGVLAAFEPGFSPITWAP